LIIENLKTYRFRNLINYCITLSKRKNLIFGLNGTGKTSLLEAIFITAFGKSFLNVKKSDIINENSDNFKVTLSVSSPKGNNTIKGIYKNKFFLYLNEKRSDIFEINNYLYPVYFSSSNYNSFIESKTQMRKMIDRFIFGINSLYIRYILSYNKALKQKNYLLKTNQKIIDQISSWNKIISEMSEHIINIKMEFINTLNNEISKKFNHDLIIDFSPSFNIYEDKESKNKLNISRDFFLSQLEAMKSSELIYKRSLLGPHLDGFDIQLKSKHLKLFSSGEKKINLLMVYIAFIELFKGLKNEYPVFLVDDFDTAIDKKNINFLMENYPNIQVIATSVNKNTGFDKLIELRQLN
jgi:DNA replication and repair protein RecF